MTTDQDPSRPEDEARLVDLFSVLKQVQPSLEARASFRSTVAHELARGQVNVSRSQKSWGKRLGAASWAFLMGLATGVFATVYINRPHPVVDPARAVKQSEGDQAPQPDEPPTDGGSSEQPILDHYSTVTYLCGVGQLSTTSTYVIREDSRD